MTATTTDHLIYLAVHTQGYDTHADLVLLAAPHSREPELRHLAERICHLSGSQNGRYRTESAAWAWQLLRQQPHLFYGHIPGLEAEGLAPEIRLARYAQRTETDLGEDVPDVLIRAALARNGDRQHYPERAEDMYGTL